MTPSARWRQDISICARYGAVFGLALGLASGASPWPDINYTGDSGSLPSIMTVAACTVIVPLFLVSLVTFCAAARLLYCRAMNKTP